VRDLAGGPRRFVELQRTLPGISTEQMRSRLNRMVADDLLTRSRYREVPPRVDYELTERGRALLPVVGALARWGYQWAWGPPRPGENVDVGAILRAATGLVMPRSLDGVFEIAVTQPGRGLFAYTLTVSDGVLDYAERPADDADARIAGPESAFVEVFSDPGDRTELEVSGDERLAESLIDVLRDSARRTAAAGV
jgi:DNA-binding HxlR family transcriptional regulator